MIHVVNGQNNEILDVITEQAVLFNTHNQSLENRLEQFDFDCLMDLGYVDKLTDRNRLIIPAEDNGYKEFVIRKVIKLNDKIEVYTTASYLELLKAKIITPTTLNGYTGLTALAFATNDTEWQVGIVESDATATIDISTHTNPFSLLKRIAQSFNLELRFRVETNDNQVTGRYVDLLDRVGAWDGREVTFGKDLDTIERSEDTSDIFTALLCLGPEDTDGNRLEVLVEDADALQRWGRPDPTGVLKHLIDVYEPQSNNLEMSLSDLEQYGRTELNKRINAVITYKANIVDLENVSGMENKKIRFGDTIRIKDETFNPPLYIEARVFEQSRDIFNHRLKEVVLGDFVEFTEEQVTSALKLLQQQIREKISESELLKLTYDKPTVDGKDTQVKTDAEQDATQKAQQAETVSKAHADQVASTAETNAKSYTNTVKLQLDNDLLDKADLTYVDGALTSKANKADTYTITEVDNALNSKVSTTQYTTDVDGIVLELDDHESRITQTESAITTKVESTTFNSLAGRVDTAESTITQHSSKINAKAESSTVNAIESRVSSAELDIDGLNSQITLKADNSTVNSIESRLSSAEIEINGLDSEIALKVNKDGIIGAINLSSESATIDAANINLVGAVTVLSDITGNLGTISAGTINGVNINGSAFNQTGTNGSITLDDNGLIFDGANSSIEMNVITTSGFHGDIASLVFKDDQGLRAMEIYQHYTDSVLRSDRALYVMSGDQGLFLDGSAYYNAFGGRGVEIVGGLTVSSGGSNTLEVSNANGLITIGTENPTYAHLKTNASRFYFDKTIDVNGEIRVYDSTGVYENKITSSGVFGRHSHSSGYFTIHSYNDSTYDDGTSARFFYAGKGTSSFAARTLHFSTTSGGLSLSAAGFNQTSLLEKKTNIFPFDKSVLDDYRHNLDLYKFDYVDNGGNAQNNIGFVIGEGYRAPEEIMNADKTSASLYNFASYNAKAIKEVVSIYDEHETRINTLADRVNYLEMENQVLKQRLNQLEGAA